MLLLWVGTTRLKNLYPEKWTVVYILKCPSCLRYVGKTKRLEVAKGYAKYKEGYPKFVRIMLDLRNADPDTTGS